MSSLSTANSPLAGCGGLRHSAPIFRIDLLMSIAKACFLFAICIGASPAWAGDAVAFDYARGLGGIYYSSSREGGADYMESPDARAPALASARKQGARSPIVIHQSDLTGYFCLAVGFNQDGRYVAYVGHGDTAVNAKADALKGVKAYGAVSKPDVIHEYFSYGTGSKEMKLTK